ncbi:MAG: hypothetical protein K0S41_922 [Anaerocolumna sp.]|jgi:hypothetical protein|nr:hypothetical protein [Anaerocolumna sp.]
MKKSRLLYSGLIIAGVVLIIIGFYVSSRYGDSLKSTSGICFGIGAGLIGMSFAQLVLTNYELKHPDVAKQNKIELNDERNTIIRLKARAKAGEILKWFIIAFEFLLIWLNVDLYLILLLWGIYLSYYLIKAFYTVKYQNEI